MFDKACGTCKQVKPADAFSKNSSRPDGLQRRCKACVAEHYRANADRIRASVNVYRSANRSVVLQRKREYRERFPERVKAQAAAAYAARSDYYKERAARFYANNRDRQLALNSQWQQLNRDSVRAASSTSPKRCSKFCAQRSTSVTGRSRK